MEEVASEHPDRIRRTPQVAMSEEALNRLFAKRFNVVAAGEPARVGGEEEQMTAAPERPRR